MAELIEMNKHAIIDELSININRLSDILQSTLPETLKEMELPIDPKLTEIYMDMSSINGYIIALMSQLVIFERGIDKAEDKQIGFTALMEKMK